MDGYYGGSGYGSFHSQRSMQGNNYGYCSSGNCSNGRCSNGSCPRGSCSNGSCSNGSCSNGRCSNGRCSNGGNCFPGRRGGSGRPAWIN